MPLGLELSRRITRRPAMRKILSGVMGLIFLGPLVQAAENDTSTDQPSTQSANGIYAQNLDYTINIIVDEYVRPVSRTDLVFAALTALYEAAKVPIPSTLRADVEAAKSDRTRITLITQTR